MVNWKMVNRIILLFQKANFFQKTFMQKLVWQLSHFSELALSELYEILKARAEVFVVEQTCAYLDLDGVDAHCHHLMLRNEARDLLAYARLIPPNLKFEPASIGRVITAKKSRGKGLGRLVMQESILRLRALYPNAAIQIAAQAHLEKFYESFGFYRISEEYDEDGIAHINMLLPYLSSGASKN
jgi:ElaA protein